MIAVVFPDIPYRGDNVEVMARRVRPCQCPPQADFGNQRKQLETIERPGPKPVHRAESSLCAVGVKEARQCLGFLFGFNARLGRMHHFLATIALAIVMTAICFVIAGSIFHSTPRGMLNPASLMTWPVISAAVFFGWMTFTLQSMRVRDIGGDLVCVIPAWIAILRVDHGRGQISVVVGWSRA